jgi:glycosyltransferase involved in cell wall biosynthesis
MNTTCIFHIIDNLRRAGAQRELVNLVTGLAPFGYDQHVYCLNDVFHPDIVREMRQCGARVVILGRAQMASLLGIARLLGDMSRLRPEIVHTRLFVSDIIGRTLARVAEVPLIVTNIETRNIDKQTWQFLLDRLTIHWADRVVFNSQHVIPFSVAFERVQPEQALHIPNGICLAAPDPAARARLQAELTIPHDAQILGMLGRLAPQKGYPYLLEALARVVAQHPNVVQLIIGDGPLLDVLTNQAQQLGIRDNIRFTGGRSDVPDLLAALDLYVHSSLFEGLPNSVMEAMLAGKPVICTSVDGVPEIIDHGVTGWLVPPRDAAALARQICYALEHPAEASRIGEAAANLIATQYSVERMVQSFHQLYSDLRTLRTTSHNQGLIV